MSETKVIKPKDPSRKPAPLIVLAYPRGRLLYGGAKLRRPARKKVHKEVQRDSLSELLTYQRQAVAYPMRTY